LYLIPKRFLLKLLH